MALRQLKLSSRHSNRSMNIRRHVWHTSLSLVRRIQHVVKEKHMSRKDWDVYFMEIAQKVSERATCPGRMSVRSLFETESFSLQDTTAVSEDNPHCTGMGCMMEDGHCVRTVHSEANAIIQAAKAGTSIEGATIYVTASPAGTASTYRQRRNQENRLRRSLPRRENHSVREELWNCHSPLGGRVGTSR